MSFFRKLVRRVSLILHPIESFEYFVGSAEDLLKRSTRAKLDYSLGHKYNTMICVHHVVANGEIIGIGNVLLKNGAFAGHTLKKTYLEKIKKDYIEGKLHRVDFETSRKFLRHEEFDLSV